MKGLQMDIPIKKVKKEYVIVGGIAAAGIGYYFYKKHKEEEANNLETNATPEADRGLTNQSFIPVVGGPEMSGVGAVGSGGTSGGGSNEGLSAIIGILGEQNQARREEVANERTNSREERASKEQTLREEGARREESRRETEAANRERAKEESENNNKVLEYMTNANAQTFTGMFEAIKGLTGGGAPGTTPARIGEQVSGNAGGKPEAHTVGKVAEKAKSLFGGRKIANPNTSESYIVSANGKHCPNDSYNRGHPKHMRGCT